MAAGGVPPLVALVRSGTDAQKTFASEALWHLSELAENQIVIANAGGVPALVSLVRDGDEVQRENATGALMKLAETKANKALIAKASDVAVLLEMIRDVDGGDVPSPPAVNTEVIQEEMDGPTNTKGPVNPISNVAIRAPEAGSATKTTIPVTVVGDVEITIPALMSVLREGSAADKTTALTALLDRPEWEDNPRLIFRNGLDVLSDLLRDSSGANRLLAVKALRRIITLRGCLARRPSPSAIPPLVAMIRDGCDAEKLEAALFLGRMMERDPDYQAVFVEAGGIPALVALLQAGNDAQQRTATRLLDVLAAKKQRANQSAVAAAGGVPALIELANSDRVYPNKTVKAILRRVSFRGVSRSVITSTASVFTTLLGVNNNDRQKSLVLDLLLRLAAEEVARSAIAEAGGIPLLIAFVRNGNDAQKSLATRLLSCLAILGANKAAIIAAGGIPPLEALAKDGNDDQKRSAAAAVCRLTASNEAGATTVGPIDCTPDPMQAAYHMKQLRIGDQVINTTEDDILTLVALANDGSTDEKAQVACVLCQFAAEGQGYVITGADGVQALVALVRDGDSGAKICTLRALELLVLQNNAGAEIAAENGVPVLTALLVSGNDDEHRTIAIRVLRGVSARKRNTLGITSTDVSARLVEQLRSGNDEQKEVVAAAMRQFTVFPGNQDAVGKAGAIPLLVTLASDGNAAQKVEAIGALCMLAQCRSNQRPIAELGSVWLLISSIRDANNSHKMESVSALWALVKSLRSEATVEKLGVIPALVAVVRYQNIKRAAEMLQRLEEQ